VHEFLEWEVFSRVFVDCDYLSFEDSPLQTDVFPNELGSVWIMPSDDFKSPREELYIIAVSVDLEPLAI
jgi:hypothetical protein